MRRPSESHAPNEPSPSHDTPYSSPEPAAVSLLGRGAFGGAMMGLANLVPGISGGTMLLAAGIYPRFVTAVAEVTTLKLRVRSLVLLASVAIAAGITIVFLASPTKHLVVNHRWVMYSLFIGLTLGGLPLVHRLVRPMNAQAWVAAGIAFTLMTLMAFVKPSSAGASSSMLMLFFGGVAGASAMILPGVSGAYLLLLLGQYVPILDAISQAKAGLLGSGDEPRDFALFLQALRAIVPVGIGVVVGIAGVSNLLRLLLARFPKPTLGALIGLLLGAIAGLWPFAEFVRPADGYVYKGQALTTQQIDELPLEEYPIQLRTPTPVEGLGAIALIALGFGVTLLVDRVGRAKPEKAR